MWITRWHNNYVSVSKSVIRKEDILEAAVDIYENHISRRFPRYTIDIDLYRYYYTLVSALRATLDSKSTTVPQSSHGHKRPNKPSSTSAIRCPHERSPRPDKPLKPYQTPHGDCTLKTSSVYLAGLFLTFWYTKMLQSHHSSRSSIKAPFSTGLFGLFLCYILLAAP